MVFTRYTAEERKEHALKLVEEIKEAYMLQEDCGEAHMYLIPLQDLRFRCAYTDEEMYRAAFCTYDLFDRMKERVEAGIDQQALEQAWKGSTQNKDTGDSELADLSRMFSFVSTIMDKGMWEIYFEIARTMRVGGAYLMLISGPAFQSAIYSSYDVLLRAAGGMDHSFDPEKAEQYTPFFLMRAAMRMHSAEIGDNADGE